MKRTVILLSIVTLFFFTRHAVYAQTVNPNWRKELVSAMDQFLKCESRENNKTVCQKYLGESLKTVYQLNDFYSPQLGRYLLATEISRYLKETDKWSLLGPSYDQKTLMTAQELANANKAVVAVYMNATGIGHVVLITPGDLHNSGSWGLNVPNVASFFLSEPERSFVDKGLSYAFQKNLMKDIVLYARKY